MYSTGPFDPMWAVFLGLVLSAVLSGKSTPGAPPARALQRVQRAPPARFKSLFQSLECPVDRLCTCLRPVLGE